MKDPYSYSLLVALLCFKKDLNILNIVFCTSIIWKVAWDARHNGVKYHVFQILAGTDRLSRLKLWVYIAFGAIARCIFNQFLTACL